MANSNWANITWSHNFSAGTDFVVKYITSKHQIAWGLYGVALPLEILPAPALSLDLIPQFHGQLEKTGGEKHPWLWWPGVDQRWFSRGFPLRAPTAVGVL